MRRTLIALAALGLVLGAGDAAMAKPSFPTRLSIKLNVDARAAERGAYEWHGRARSDKHACETGRKVVLFNEAESGPLGNDLTDNQGKWRITLGVDTLGGDYYAKVRRDETPDYVCRGDRSENYPFPTR